jgi:hypothetical protein
VINGLRRTFRDASPAIDALVGRDEQHGLPFVKTFHRADGDAVGILASETGFCHDHGHCQFLSLKIEKSGFQMANAGCGCVLGVNKKRFFDFLEIAVVIGRDVI